MKEEKALLLSEKAIADICAAKGEIMKKRLGVIAIIVLLSLCLTMAFTACKNDEENGGSGDGGDGGLSIAEDYDYQAIESKINELAGQDGVYLKVHVIGVTSSGENGSYDMAFGKKNNVYYFLGEDEELYYDLSADNYAVTYTKSDNVWSKHVCYYDEIYTKQFLLRQADHLNVLAVYLGYYRTVTPGEGTKTTATVAGRTCDKYSLNVVNYGATYSQEVCIDKETGACLKYAARAAAGGESAGVAIECTEFSVHYTPVLPTVDAAHTTTYGDNGGSGGNGEGGGNQGGSGEGAGGQGQGTGGQSQGTGGQGEGAGGEQQTSPFLGKKLSVTSADIPSYRALEASFEGGYLQLYPELNFECISNFGCMLGYYGCYGSATSGRAVLNVFKIYSDGAYDYETAEAMAEPELVFNNGAYTLTFEVEIDDEVVEVTLGLQDAGNVTAHDNTVCPLDPNGYGLDPVYQVSQKVWEGIFDGEYMFEEIGNFTVEYSVASQTYPFSGKFLVDYDAINDNDMMIHVRKTWEKDENGQYQFQEYYSDGKGGWNSMGTGYFDLTNWWDSFMGTIPAEFMKAGYGSTDHYYYINSFSYVPEGSSQQRSITNFRVWFKNNLLEKIQYTCNGETYTYEFSEYGDTEVDEP